MFWIYKCNSQRNAHQRTWGDWAEVFETNDPQWWGTTRVVPDLAKARPGHTLIAYQTNRNELVGLARVVGWESDGRSYQRLVLRPTKRLGVKVRPLKQSSPKVARIPALQPGEIKTLYEISDADARCLLKAAGAELTNIARNAIEAERTMKGAGFGTPERNKLIERSAVRHVKRFFKRQGWYVSDVAFENRGYDLVCQRGPRVRHVEVKGASGEGQQFIITAKELSTWKGDKNFTLAFVAESLSESPTLTFFPGRTAWKAFDFQPLAYVARRTVQGRS